MPWYDWALLAGACGACCVFYWIWRDSREEGDRSEKDALGGGVDRPRRFARAGDPPLAARGDVVIERSAER